MKRFFKIIGIVLLCLLVAWIIFVTIDCVRLKNAETNTQPLISINIKDYENEGRSGSIYTGLGYSVQYYKIKNTAGNGANFKLFNIIPIWSWEAQ